MKSDHVESVTLTLPQTIAIDGPAASGKTTLGRLLAQKLGYLFLDTGSMYRAVTLAALQRGINTSDEEAVTELTRCLKIEIYPPEPAGDGRLYTVLVDGLDVTWELRAPAVDRHVSEVSAYPGVRAEMVRQQRLMAHTGRVVMVGRDIGTVVLPDAPLKLYVVASAEVRAHRRWLERQARDSQASYDQILADIQRRDEIDSHRPHSPLKPAGDAILLDSSHHSPEALLDDILHTLSQLDAPT